MAANYKKSPVVPTQKVRPKFPRVKPLRLPLLKTKIYSKGVTAPANDPAQYADFGFGDTGSPPLTGEFK